MNWLKYLKKSLVLLQPLLPHQLKIQVKKEVMKNASSTVNVELTSVGEQKIAIIKAVKEITGAGLKEAKDMVDEAPSIIKEGVKREEAEEMKKSIESKGASVTLK